MPPGNSSTKLNMPSIGSQLSPSKSCPSSSSASPSAMPRLQRRSCTRSLECRAWLSHRSSKRSRGACHGSRGRQAHSLPLRENARGKSQQRPRRKKLPSRRNSYYAVYSSQNHKASTCTTPTIPGQRPTIHHQARTPDHQPDVLSTTSHCSSHQPSKHEQQPPMDNENPCGILMPTNDRGVRADP